MDRRRFSPIGPHHYVIRRPSHRLVVLFSGTNKPDGVFDFWNYAQGVPHSVILLNNGEDRWYQQGVPGFGEGVEGTVKRIQAIARSVKATDISLIGASMGGSAAVMYGSLIGGRVLAFSFEAKLCKAGSRSAKYIPSDYLLTYPDLTPLIESAAFPITSVLGGGDLVDVVTAHELRHTKNLRTILLRGVDHGVPRRLRLDESLHGLLDAFIEDQPLPRLREEDDDLENAAYVEALGAAQDALLTDRPDDAVTAARAALEQMPNSFAAHTLLGGHFTKAGRHDQALMHIATAAALSPWSADAEALLGRSLRHALLAARPNLLSEQIGRSRALSDGQRHDEALVQAGLAMALSPADREVRLVFGGCLRRAGRLSNAEAVHTETLDSHPADHRVMYDLGLTLMAAGREEEGEALIRSASRLAPNSASYAARLARIERTRASSRTAPESGKRQAAERPPAEA